MEINSGNKKRIDEYIKEHPQCNLQKTFPLILQGKKNDLPVYRIPLEYLYYNIRNGRFASEYKQLVEKEGGDLEPEKPEDAKKIKKLLLELDVNSTEVTKQDILKRGQWNDGVITDDGYVIDGNRRMAILSSLSEAGEDKWNYINVARLPPNVDPKDLWKIEAGVQLGKDEIVRYGPINELLKFKEGIDAGVSPKEISTTLYGYEDKVDEIEEKLERLKLIEEFLKFIGRPYKYKEAEGKVEHFIDLQRSILKTAKNNGMTAIEQAQIKNIVYDLIAHSNITHQRLRKMKNMILLGGAKEELFKASKYALPTDPAKAVESGYKRETLEDLVKKTVDPDLDEDEGDQYNTVMTIFANAEDILKANENRGNVERLLITVKTNLEVIPLDSPDLKKKELQETIKQIVRHAEKLRPFIEAD